MRILAALNGFNDAADRKELEHDLKQAISDFDDALASDPAFVDAKIGKASCLGNLAFLYSMAARCLHGECTSSM